MIWASEMQNKVQSQRFSQKYQDTKTLFWKYSFSLKCIVKRGWPNECIAGIIKQHIYFSSTRTYLLKYVAHTLFIGEISNYVLIIFVYQITGVTSTPEDALTRFSKFLSERPAKTEASTCYQECVAMFQVQGSPISILDTSVTRDYLKVLFDPMNKIQKYTGTKSTV